MNHKGRRRKIAGVSKKSKFPKPTVHMQSSLLSYMAEPTPKPNPIKPLKPGNGPTEPLKDPRPSRRLKHEKRWKNNDENKNYRPLRGDRDFE